ncbi:MAG: metal-dependent hydrolase [Phycisphaeraceae bacterium]
MPLTLTYLGHAGFLFDDGRHQLAVDPFLTGNELARHKPGDITCQHIALTHGHEDHFGDTLAIAQANNAELIAVHEICNYAASQGVEKINPGNTGGRIDTDFGYIAFTQAFHSSSYQGQYMGMPCGLIIHMGGVTLYHCGDTTLFSDMRLIADIYQPDLAVIPVGDRFTMGPELAARAAEMIRPRIAIPVHYKTFPLLRQSIAGFDPPGVEVKELAPGETWTYEATE